ncbi:MAG: hypothetical protein IT532_15495 [Burkholderiales bacterium]|nr:hypothetical protein [Burkholderiales bacterium]
MPRRDQSKLEAQLEVSRVLDNLMHKRPRHFFPRFPRSGLYVHSLENLEHLDAPLSHRRRDGTDSDR